MDRWLCFLSRLSDTFWSISGYCNGCSCHLKSSSTVCPAAPFLLSHHFCLVLVTPSRAAALLHPLSHWDVFSPGPQCRGEEVTEKQFHGTFLGCFSNFICLLISLKLPREGAVFLSLLPFSLADLFHHDN